MPDYGYNTFTLLHAVTVTVTPMDLSAIKQMPSKVQNTPLLLYTFGEIRHLNTRDTDYLFYKGARLELKTFYRPTVLLLTSTKVVTT